MSFSSRLLVSQKIYGGFGVIIVLLMIVSGIELFALNSTGNHIHDYAAVSANALRVSQINGNIAEMRRNVARFYNDGDEKSLKRIREMQDELKSLFPKAIEATHDSKRLANLKRMNEIFEEYSKGFEKVPQLFSKKDKIIKEEMNVYGSKARKNYSEILKSAMNDNDNEAAALTGLTEEALMMVRISALRFLSDPKGDGKKQVEERMPDYIKKAEKLVERLNNPTRKKLAQETEDLGKKYQESFSQVATTVTELDTLVNQDMAKLGTEIRTLAEETLDSQKQALETIEKETMAGIISSEFLGTSASIIAILLGIVFALVIARAIIRPVKNMTSAMTRLADGDKTVNIPATENTDEIGEMARAVLVFKKNAIEKERLELEQEEQKRRAEAERKAAMLQLANSFEGQVGGVINAVTSAAVELQASSKQMAATATETSAQATAVASSAEESSSNVQAVASATEELSNSIKEIAQQIERTRTVAVKADSEAKHSTALIEKLSENVTSIGEIVNMINDIASQTNLLALNATIEAARAGDAGKGFAVVASEVKNLAAQTAKATEEVSIRISTIQSGTSDAVQAISSISQVISEMSSISNSVAAAVEQQGAATHEIARNVEQASIGTKEVSKNIGSVETAAQETGAAATQISNSASDLSVQADTLKREVNNFLEQIRSDKENMKLIKWDGSIAVNYPRIDDYHKKIFDQLNSFYAKMMTGDGLSGAAEMTVWLSSHLKAHFADEESLMSANAYPDANTHRDQHNDCWNNFLRLKRNVELGEANGAKDLFDFVTNWLQEHIKKHDRALADYLRRRKAAA